MASFSLLSFLTPLNIFIVILAYQAYARTKYYFMKKRLQKEYNASWPQVPNTYIPLNLLIPYTILRLFFKDQVLGKKIDKLQHMQSLFKNFPKNNQTFQIEALGEVMIFTLEPENVKAVLATQFNDFGKGKVFHKVWYDFLGDGIFNVDHEMWSHSRALLRPQFLKQRVSDLKCFERHFQDLLTLIPENSLVEMQDIWHRFTLDSATDFLFGESVNSLLNPKIRFAEAFATIQKLQIIRMQGNSLLRMYKQEQFFEALDVLDKFIEPFVERAILKSTYKDDKKTEEDYNFLDALADFTNDKKVLRDQLVSTLLAGRDTTACTLTFITIFLSRNPEIFAKLRNEIMDTVGYEIPTYEDLKGMKYLQNVINETLRLCPIVPGNERTALKTTTLPCGGGPDGKSPIVVREGTKIGYSAIVMQRREDLFGKDVLDFKPERWDKWAPKPWTYIPFNGGPRICLGQQFAIVEMSYAVTRLSQRFSEIKNLDPEPLQFDMNIVLTSLYGAKVAFTTDKAFV